MSEPFEERALRNLRERHTDQLRVAATRIREYAGYILSDLDAGRPLTYHLVSDAIEIERRGAALEAITDACGIYDSAPED